MLLMPMLNIATILGVVAGVNISKRAIVHNNGSEIHEAQSFFKGQGHHLDYDRSHLAVRANYWGPEQIADDVRWTKYVEKGQHLRCLMEAPDKTAGWLLKDKRDPPSAASEWRGDLIDARKTWYWHETPINQDHDCDFDKKRLKDAFRGVGLNAKPAQPAGDGNKVCYRIEHVDAAVARDPKNPKKLVDQKYTVGAKEYTATGGLYWFAINHKGGAIVATNLENPLVGTKYNWEKQAKPDQLPHLRLCSDILWGYWFQSNPTPANLRIYGVYNVVNDETSSLAARALTSNDHETLIPWPGVSFDHASPEGQALIGSPLGSIIAHLLVGHKAELGVKRIRRVEVCYEP